MFTILFNIISLYGGNKSQIMLKSYMYVYADIQIFTLNNENPFDIIPVSITSIYV